MNIFSLLNFPTLSTLSGASAPDEELLALAADGRLSKQLPATIDRMMLDPKVEGFLDSFPAQWTQLNAKPDARNPDFKYYYARKDLPASSQMVLEPLLLFDTIYMENRPIIELIKCCYRRTMVAPRFSIRIILRKSQTSSRFRWANRRSSA